MIVTGCEWCRMQPRALTGGVNPAQVLRDTVIAPHSDIKNATCYCGGGTTLGDAGGVALP
jgi:hypothetical protein